MPPIPDVTTPHPPKDNWAWAHYDDFYHKPRKAFPTPNREPISEANPLEIDVFYSMRSPYSYLSLFRLAYLHSNFNVNVNIRVIFPIAARTAKPGQKSALGGRWYFWGYSVGLDMTRTAQYEGIPWRFANPDPILADTYPPESGTQITAPMEKQPYITWLVRLANAAQLEGKALEYCLAVSPLIWGAQTKLGEWPFHVEAAVNSIGMDYSAVIEDIRANPDKYDDVWQQNQEDFQMTGQGGVPTMSFNGEPFFGQDRFNQFFWRLRQNGLTQRKVPREPIVAKPLRWPISSGGE
ncbi:MAG: DsbA family protein [Planctomycetota bacterium]|nr:DsbA family protein [Planctomycetota bacterium]